MKNDTTVTVRVMIVHSN